MIEQKMNVSVVRYKLQQGERQGKRRKQKILTVETRHKPFSILEESTFKCDDREEEDKE